MSGFKSIEWREGALVLLDQRQLPASTECITYHDHQEAAQAIRDMVVRGAPAIGVTAAYALCLPSVGYGTATDADVLREGIRKAIEVLAASRPTAVNLFWALERMRRVLETSDATTGEALQADLLEEAHRIFHEDRDANLRLCENGVALLPDGARILHHCNTGSLATVDYGTALGVIRLAHEKGKNVHAFLSETRPRLQGASLSAYEMKAFGVPFTLLVDGAAAFLMRTKGVDCVIVGCDRVAANGDTANKIGTYMHALCARAHGVPFYVACPTSTIDLALASGEEIPVEERDGREITEIRGVRITPEDTPTWNPAFDVTPAELITAFITERGVVRPPFRENLAQILAPKTEGA